MSHVPIPPVRLHNIRDAAAFTVEIVNRMPVSLTESEREELIGEGLTRLVIWANVWNPEDHGDGTGSFLGYASKFLPGRLLDAWHAWHPEHSYIKHPDGARRYAYGRPAESLYDAEGNTREFVATACTFATVDDQDSIDSALRLLPAEYRIGARPVVNGTLEGLPAHEIARRSRMTTANVHEIRAAIGSAMHQTTMEAA